MPAKWYNFFNWEWRDSNTRTPKRRDLQSIEISALPHSRSLILKNNLSVCRLRQRDKNFFNRP